MITHPPSVPGVRDVAPERAFAEVHYNFLATILAQGSGFALSSVVSHVSLTSMMVKSFI